MRLLPLSTREALPKITGSTMKFKKKISTLSILLITSSNDLTRKKQVNSVKNPFSLKIRSTSLRLKTQKVTESSLLGWLMTMKTVDPWMKGSRTRRVRSSIKNSSALLNPQTSRGRLRNFRAMGLSWIGLGAPRRGHRLKKVFSYRTMMKELNSRIRKTASRMENSHSS
jgi:hypothetical protein